MITSHHQRSHSGRHAWPWKRVRRRDWVRPDNMLDAAAVFAAIPSLPRSALARLTQHMIDRMDELDGDPDLEATGEDDEDTNDREQENAF